MADVGAGPAGAGGVAWVRNARKGAGLLSAGGGVAPGPTPWERYVGELRRPHDGSEGDGDG